MTRLTVGRDSNSSLTYVRKLSDSVAKCSIPPSGTRSVTVPIDKRVAILSYQPGSTVDVGINSAPDAYTTDFVLASGVEDQLPTAIAVVPGDTLYFTNIDTTDPARVEVSFYRV